MWKRTLLQGFWNQTPLAYLFYAGLLFLMPAGARAECGDYVVLGSKPAPATDKAASADMMLVQDARHHASPGMPKPCHGPNCSKRQLPPAPVSGRPVIEVSEHWARPVEQVIQERSEPGSSLKTANLINCASCTLEIFHPPR
jgi:hypothetical protein